MAAASLLVQRVLIEVPATFSQEAASFINYVKIQLPNWVPS